MNLEELKLEAEKLGYKLIKKPENIKLERCTCGGKPHEMFRIDFGDSDDSGYIYTCPNCGLKSEAARTHIGAKREWNRMIEERIDHMIEEEMKRLDEEESDEHGKQMGTEDQS